MQTGSPTVSFSLGRSVACIFKLNLNFCYSSIYLYLFLLFECTNTPSYVLCAHKTGKFTLNFQTHILTLYLYLSPFYLSFSTSSSPNLLVFGTVLFFTYLFEGPKYNLCLNIWFTTWINHRKKNIFSPRSGKMPFRSFFSTILCVKFCFCTS